MPATSIDVDALAAEIAERICAIPHQPMAAVRAVRREYSRVVAAAPPDQVLALAHELLARPDVDRVVADELIANHREAAVSLTGDELERLGRGMAGWDAVDCFATILSGPAWRRAQIGDEVIAAWAASPDRWWRRAALVSTTGLNVRARGGTGDTARTLAVCRLLLHDRDDMVVKAMSWALRELVPHDPEAVSDFLDEHRDTLAARVQREVRHKLTTGLKNPRRPAAQSEQSAAS
jgi:3-methyladenine DNA glycosylase AlkD